MLHKNAIKPFVAIRCESYHIDSSNMPKFKPGTVEKNSSTAEFNYVISEVKFLSKRKNLYDVTV